MVLNTKPYYTLKEFIAFLESSLRLYADNGYIKEHILKPIIMQCSETLGYRLHNSKACKLLVENYSAPIPDDLWKIENMFGLMVYKESSNLNALQGISQSWHFGDPKFLYPDLQTKIIKLGMLPPTEENCHKPIQVSAFTPNYFKDVEKKVIVPLRLSNSVKNKCAVYSPCKGAKSSYEVDINDQEFRFSFKQGEVFLSYLGMLTDEEGEILIPSHPLLFPYYEWSAKAAIMEDLLFNSEDDVVRKLEYAEVKRKGAKYDAMNFILSPQEKQLENLQKTMQIEYYNKWYKMFE